MCYIDGQKNKYIVILFLLVIYAVVVGRLTRHEA
jgi:hypothetical protein